MNQAMRMLAMGMVVLGLGACDEEAGEKRVEDQGVACLLEDFDGVATVREGEAVQITVDFGCIGEHTLVDSDCVVTGDGGVLEVSAWAAYTQSQEQLGLPALHSPTTG